MQLDHHFILGLTRTATRQGSSMGPVTCCRSCSMGCLSPFEETEVLRLAASLENASEHPLASAIVRAAKERSIALSKASEFDSPTGKGVRKRW